MTSQPPERFHVFVSYTTRVDEVQRIKPLVDHFLLTVLGPIIEQTIGEPPVFYDGYTLHTKHWFSDAELERAIRFAIEESEVLLAFLTPEYFGSHWCIFEFSEMVSKELRPWFDLCREAPISELQDKRPVPLRPGSWECFKFRARMHHWRATNPRREPGGEIVPIVVKGEITVPPEMHRSSITQSFDWKPCLSTADAAAKVHSQLFLQAQMLDPLCQERMTETALAVAEILRQRRLRYARSGR